MLIYGARLLPKSKKGAAVSPPLPFSLGKKRTGLLPFQGLPNRPFQLGFVHGARPLLKHRTVGADQEEMGLHPKSQRSLQRFGARVVDIQVHETYPVVILRFQPVNHRRHLSAGRSPKGEEFDELHLARGELHGGGVGGLQGLLRGR